MIKDAQYTHKSEEERKKYIEALRTLKCFKIPTSEYLLGEAQVVARQVFEGGRFIGRDCAENSFIEHLNRTPHMSSSSSATQRD